MLDHELLKACFSKFFLSSIHRFRDTVAKEEQHVSDSKLDTLLLKAGVGQKSKHRATSCQTLHHSAPCVPDRLTKVAPCPAETKGRRVASVHKSQNSTRLVVGAVK